MKDDTAASNTGSKIVPMQPIGINQMEITKEELLQLIDKELLAEKLAEKIFESKWDLIDNEFDTETLKVIRETGYKVVAQIITEYELKDDLIRKAKTIMEGFKEGIDAKN